MWYGAILSALLGAILASFAGVVSERLNTGHSFVRGRSICNSCGRTLGALDLLPVVSWLLTLGHCRSCDAKVPLRYLLIEIVLAALFFVTYLIYGFTLASFILGGIYLTLAVIVLYDLRHMIVPLPAALMLLFLSLLYAGTSFPAHFPLTLMTAGAIGLGFFLLHALSGGRWMGLGDAPVALSLTLVAGAKMAIPGLLYSFWIGAVIGIGILVMRPKGHRMGIEVPFVPFLAAGYLLAFLTQWNPFIL